MDESRSLIYECEITQEILDVMADVTMLLPNGKKFLKRYRMRCLSGVLMLLLVSWVFEGISRMIVLIGAAVLMLIIIFGSRKIYRSSLTRMQKKTDPTMRSGFRKYTFLEEKVVVESALGKSEFKWEAFAFFTEYKHYIIISLKDNRSLAVDTDKLSADEQDVLFGLLNDNVERIAV